MVYYNEHDSFAAAWLRELIAAGRIAFGVVDERSIEDVLPSELRQFKQCHFFAGIGVWSYALRRAGWPDDRQVWTGSCPCQPFSAAGKGDGFADERHLWPAFHHLIEQCKPDVVFGEQVASKDGLAWLDLVLADLEGTGYAAGAVDTCSAGFGAPHIRQRLYWLADSEMRWQSRGLRECGSSERAEGAVGGHCAVGWVGDDDDARLERFGNGHQAESRWNGAVGSVTEAGEFSGSGDAANQSCERITRGIPGTEAQEHDERVAVNGGVLVGLEHAGTSVATRPLPTNGHWGDADWLFCRDGKWRPVEPGTFPLAHGASARVGRLRGYGNALNAEAAQGFIEAYMSATL